MISMRKIVALKVCNPMKKLLFIILLAAGSSNALAEGGYWQGVADEIAVVLNDAEKIYAQGDAKRAKKAVQHAYFGLFESSKMEAALRKEIGAKPTYLVERKFGDMRKAIVEKTTVEDLHALAEDLRGALSRDAIRLDKAGIAKDVFTVNQ